VSVWESASASDGAGVGSPSDEGGGDVESEMSAGADGEGGEDSDCCVDSAAGCVGSAIGAVSAAFCSVKMSRFSGLVPAAGGITLDGRSGATVAFSTITGMVDKSASS
jgi:hypothetical protein